MNSWQGYDLFEKALTYIAVKLQEITGKGKTKDVIRGNGKIYQTASGHGSSVTEIAEFAGMNPGVFDKAF